MDEAGAEGGWQPSVEREMSSKGSQARAAWRRREGSSGAPCLSSEKRTTADWSAGQLARRGSEEASETTVRQSSPCWMASVALEAEMVTSMPEKLNSWATPGWSGSHSALSDTVTAPYTTKLPSGRLMKLTDASSWAASGQPLASMRRPMRNVCVEMQS
jgi:hypothetical protein